MQYGTFWQRSFASLIDLIVLLPIYLIWSVELFTDHPSKMRELGAALLALLTFLTYTIYCHGRFGKTVGKQVMRICVTSLDGSPIGWRKAWLRSAVDIVFACVSLASVAVTLLLVPDNAYYIAEWAERQAATEAFEPNWGRWSYWASAVWAYSEPVAMLFNVKRRALHDFVAGTVVICSSQPKQSAGEV